MMQVKDYSTCHLSIHYNTHCTYYLLYIFLQKAFVGEDNSNKNCALQDGGIELLRTWSDKDRHTHIPLNKIQTDNTLMTIAILSEAKKKQK
jgi:hypothetical protein